MPLEKKTHFGRAGEFAAMAEFLLRGYNVAVPSVDVGDDIFVIDDNDGATWRVQVKTAKLDKSKAQYKLSRAHLRQEKATDLFYMFLVRQTDRWRYILIGRTELLDIRDSYVEAAKRSKKPGRKPRDDEQGDDALNLVITWKDDDALGWGASLASYLDRWPSALPEISDAGPGARNLVPSP